MSLPREAWDVLDEWGDGVGTTGHADATDEEQDEEMELWTGEDESDSDADYVDNEDPWGGESEMSWVTEERPLDEFSAI